MNGWNKWEVELSAIRVIEKDVVEFSKNDEIIGIHSESHSTEVKVTVLENNEYLVGFVAAGAIRFHKGNVSPNDLSTVVTDVHGHFYISDSHHVNYDIGSTKEQFSIVYTNSDQLLYERVANTTVFASVTHTPSTMQPIEIATPQPRSGYRQYTDDENGIGTLVILVAIVMPIVFISGISVVIWVCCCYGRDMVVEVRNTSKDIHNYQHKVINGVIVEKQELSPYPQSLT